MLTRRALLSAIPTTIIGVGIGGGIRRVMSVLNVTKSVTFNASGGGTVSIGPQDFPGTKSWHVTGVIVKTTRPGVAPIPTIDFYLNEATPDNIFGSSYDGSRNQGPTDLEMNAGMRLIAVWAGGQAGDIGYLTVTGERA